MANPIGQRPVPPKQFSKIHVLWALPSCYCSGLSTMGPTSFGEQLMDSEITATLHSSKFTETLGGFQWTRETCRTTELSVLPHWTGTSWLSCCLLGHQKQKRKPKLEVRRRFRLNSTVLKNVYLLLYRHF